MKLHHTLIGLSLLLAFGSSQAAETIRVAIGTQDTTINCATANINPANPVDRIKVVVTWSRASFSPLSKFFGATQTVTGTAVMQLVGKPS